MLYEVDWAEDGTYRPGEENSPEKFFNDCLENSKEFDLQLGYFSSAAISVLADGFASFISKGGKMRLVINHIVSEEDKEAITKGVNGGIIECFDLSNFDELRKTFDEYQQQFFDCLAFLIYDNRIDIRIIRPRNSSGIAHTKSGQFRDGDSITSFTGSANFTISGLFNNLEEIKIDRSDSVDPMTRKRIENQRKEFDKIMAQEKTNIEYLSPDELISAVKANFGDKTIEELLDVEKKIRAIKREKAIRKRAQEKQQSKNDSLIEEVLPQFPYPSGPRDYQKEAFENWKKNGQKGLFAMATGTGKTITSLNCLLEIYNRKKYYKALILVPTITLVNQWEKECFKFNFTNVIKVCSANHSWQNDLASLRTLERLRGDKVSYVIISTYASFVKDKIFDALNSFSPSQLLLIADEAHNLGATSLRKKMAKVVYGRRIGLSATPDRQFDDVGNDAINEFFNVQAGYTFEYNMKEAIENGVLCKYLYYPHLIELTDTEMDEYIAISQKIVKYFNFNKGVFDKSDEILTGLLIKRKRIIHKAINKQNVFREILKNRMDETGSLRYTLVYIPEGNKPDTYEADKYVLNDVTNDDVETQHLIDTYTSIVRDISPKTTVRKFTSESAERDEILSDFAKGNVDVLTSMKCLDEGVDVPRSELAIFCASTGNPRQFIQRRGRVLRTHPDKKMAILHDLVVAPKVAKGDNTYQMERSMLKAELMRVNNFATLSLNPFTAQQELNDIMEYYNLNLFNN